MALRFIYYDRAKPLLLEAIERLYDLASSRQAHTPALALYDLLTPARNAVPVASVSSAHVTCIATDELPRRNCPLTCQSLQFVAAWAGFRWPDALKRAFRHGHFDAYGKSRSTGSYYVRRSRHSSQLPDEYFWAAWGCLPQPKRVARQSEKFRDEFAPFRQATLSLLDELTRHRLKAMAHLIERWRADDEAVGRGNVRHGNQSSPMDIGRLAEYDDSRHTLIGALAETISLERNARLAEWLTDHAIDPRTRELSGLATSVVYYATDQDRETLSRMGASPCRQEAHERWNADGIQVTLRLKGSDTGRGSGAPSSCPFNLGDRVLVSPQTVCDMRAPESERRWHPPSVRQLLYAARAEVIELNEERGQIVVVMRNCPITCGAPYVFPTVATEPLEDGQELVLDSDPNEAYLFAQRRMLSALRESLSGEKAGRHPLYERIESLARTAETNMESKSLVPQSEYLAEAERGQGDFLAGLDALGNAGMLREEYDETDRSYIAGYGGNPMLLVQGPPGTGKTSKTVWMTLARMQGAIRAGAISWRVAYSANTHSAVDVAATKMARALEILNRVHDQAPELFSRYFDSRLLDVTLFRAAPNRGIGGEDSFSPDASAASEYPVISLERSQNKGRRGNGEMPPSRANADVVVAESDITVVFGTPSGLYSLWKERWQRTGFLNRYGTDLLVADECSRLTLPELLMAGISLQDGGTLVAIGDPRQTAPIRTHDFAIEPRRTFKRFPIAAMSAFDALQVMDSPLIRFSRSWRCPPPVARFLSEAIYQPLDKIDYHSATTDGSVFGPPDEIDDPLLAATLSSAAITLVLHDEAESEKENPFEAGLVVELLRALTPPGRREIEADKSRKIGVVVPHRAQRRLIQTMLSKQGNEPHRSITVDTVERFQGDEREVMILGATESAPLYLREAGVFFYDARRLCVALSRARKKVIIVASKQVFDLQNASDDAFEGALLWQRLKRRACTHRVWSGESHGKGVEVWTSLDERIAPISAAFS